MGKTMFLIFVVGVAALWSGLAPQCNAQLTGKQMKYLLQRHNDLRREVSPSASNMLEMVSDFLFYRARALSWTWLWSATLT